MATCFAKVGLAVLIERPLKLRRGDANTVYVRRHKCRNMELCAMGMKLSVSIAP